MKTVFCSRKYCFVLSLLGFCLFFICNTAKAFSDDIGVLINKLYADDLKIQIAAADDLGKFKDERAIRALLDFVFIKAESWKVKIRAIRILGDTNDEHVSDRLVTILNDPFLNEECPSMKWYTTMALGKDFNKGSRAVDAIIEVLGSKDVLLREAAVQSLGKIGDPKALPSLIQALADTNFAVRFSAVRALENINDSRAIPYLREIADREKDAQIREAAFSALKNFH